jgi:heterodisulfide reductase subunit A
MSDSQVLPDNNKSIELDAAGIGIFLIQTDDDASCTFDFHGLADQAAQLPGVKFVRILGAPGDLNPEKLARELSREEVGVVVVAAANAGPYRAAIARALALAGGNGEQIRLVSFGAASDCCSAEKARDSLRNAIQGTIGVLPYSLKTETFNSNTLVIGGGVAGIQASLEIAASGHKVYLVERTGTIGGRMAMFDKTFPTLDCAACILTPKMVAAGQNTNIEILPLSEVQEVTGNVGAFKVKVLKRTTHVDASACVACGDCARFCPVTTESEFDMGIASRKNIFIPFPQAVPNAYMIDAAHCRWLQSGGKKCGACAKKCTKEAIHLDAQDEIVELEVGSIIVATGYETLDARSIERYGYGAYPNVLTSLEFERLTNASGPTGGKIVLKTKRHNRTTKADEWVFEPDGPKPKAVAILHCVGSRDQNHNPYCSRVCCMYSLKFAHLVREKLPDAKCFEYYIDMRAFGKGYEEFSERIRKEGVHLLRGRPASIAERDSRLIVHGEDIANDRVYDEPVDMVILSVGLRPSSGSAELAETLGISKDRDGWFQELNYHAEPYSTAREGIFLAGVCQGPKDIPDTVTQASAAAASVLRLILGRADKNGHAGQSQQTELMQAGASTRA